MSYNNVKATFIESVNDCLRGELSELELIESIQTSDLRTLLNKHVSAEDIEPFLFGECIAPGVVAGEPVFNILDASDHDRSYILITDKVTSFHLNHLHLIKGIISLSTDSTSHAAIVCRVRNIPLLTKLRRNILNQQRFQAGDLLEILGSAKNIVLDSFMERVYTEPVEVLNPEEFKELRDFQSIVDRHRRLKVYGNADTIEEIRFAYKCGAEGIEPRTEHMLFANDKLLIFQKIILEINKSNNLLLLENQFKTDFFDILKLSHEKPALIRLFDPPFHEFLPNNEQNLESLCREAGISRSEIVTKMEKLREVNPMSGHRGVRLLITNPEIAEMQINSLFMAGLQLFKEVGRMVSLNIVIPMVSETKELLFIKGMIETSAQKYIKSPDVKVDYRIGIMMETPRAILASSELAEHIDFASFGTNDLTAQTFCFSRGDVFVKFLYDYLEKGIIDQDPFIKLDKYVKAQLKQALDAFKNSGHSINSSVCGEQTGDEESIYVLDDLGFDIISCNPPFVPIAKLVAAKSNIKNYEKGRF